MLVKKNEQLKKIAESLKSNNFDARIVNSGEEATALAVDIIPKNIVLGIGDSTTLIQINILNELKKRGVKIINPFIKEFTENPNKHQLMIKALRDTRSCDVFMTSANAITIDGKIVSIDRVGNRVVGMIFGPPKVILIIGKNKIVSNVAEAIDIIKNGIAPIHQQNRKRKTLCVKTGKCENCNVPDRACNITVILEKKPLLTDLTVILVNEDLGLGWGKLTSVQRIKKIKTNYYMKYNRTLCIGDF